MSRRFKMAYGIDVSDRHAVVVLAHGRTLETIHSAGSSEIPGPLRGRIAGDVAAGRAVSAAALACHEAIFRRVTAPFPSLDKALKVLPSVLDVQLPFPLEQCSCVFTAAQPGGQGGLDAIAIAARRDDVGAALQRLKEGGVDPVFLDHEGLAIWRQAGVEFGRPGPAGRVVVNLGPAHTTLVYGTAGSLLGAHSSRLGDDSGPRPVCARIQSWLRAQTALQASSETEWIFTGAGAEEAARPAGLQSFLGLGAVKTAKDPATFLARALALRAIAGADDFACNLRTAGLAHPMARAAAASQSKRSLSFAVIAAAALLLVNAGVLAYASKRNEDLQREIQRIASEITGAPVPRGQEVLVVQRSLDQAAVAYRPFQMMLSPGVSSRLGDVLSLCRTNGAAISKMELGPDSLRIELTAASAGGPDRISTALRFAGWQIQQRKQESSVVIEGSL